MAKIKRSTFYFWLEKLKNNIDKDNKLKEEIKDIYDENKGRYGYRRITLELRNRGIFPLSLELLYKLVYNLSDRRNVLA